MMIYKFALLLTIPPEMVDIIGQIASDVNVLVTNGIEDDEALEDAIISMNELYRDIPGSHEGLSMVSTIIKSVMKHGYQPTGDVGYENGNIIISFTHPTTNVSQ